jgi:cyclohexanone monooxygenase
MSTRYDAVIVGAGFSGMYMLYKLRQMGLSVRVYEAGTDVGGTWYWNRYPGARCDVESLDYSYSFSKDLEQQWTWSERYPVQPEILKYAQHVADTFDLRKDIQFETRVSSARFDDVAECWRVTTDKGDQVSADYCIMATGCLSTWRIPEFAGRESFRGETYHTGNWPHEGVDFSGKRVAIIGTGSSAIQAIPKIAAQAEHLTVFQRTANFSLPAGNRPLKEGEDEAYKARYDEIREAARHSPGGLGTITYGTTSALDAKQSELAELFEDRWSAGGFGMLYSYSDISVNEKANAIAAEFVRGKIRGIVKDPAVAELLCPNDHPIGTKRICMDSGYYETFNRPNVTLVNIKQTPIEAITPKGVKVGDRDYEVDCIVFATGFDAMTGALSKIDIRGHQGRKLSDDWAAGPRTYLGLGVAGFPNLFTITGPGSPSVLSNMMTSIEQHVEWITDCIAYLRARGINLIEPTFAAQDAWVLHVNEVAWQTLYPRANSWYMGANVPGKPRIFMPYIGGVGAYRAKCKEIAENGYDGFALTTLPHFRAPPEPADRVAPAVAHV